MANKLDKEKQIKSSFEIYFDGAYSIAPEPNVPSTYGMGLCKLEYNIKENILTVYLRRPGLLIGYHGRTIDALKKYLECEIKLMEVNPFK